MTQFLKKNAKLIYLIFGVFSFLFIILSCIYMTPYNKIAIDYNADFETTGEVKKLLGIFNFTAGTKTDYGYLYTLMYDTNKTLQFGNNMVLYLGVVSLAMLGIMLICANASRKKYYISNLISGIVCPAVSIIVGIVAIVASASALGSLNSDLEMINWGALSNADMYKDAVQWYKAGDTSHFIISTTPIIIYIVIMVLFVLTSAALIAYNVFRYLDTKKQLLASKNEEEAEKPLDEPVDAEVFQEKVVDANV